MNGDSARRAAPAKLASASRVAALWSFAYAVYRAYYALGGTWGILGTPASHDDWIRINAIAAALLLVTAMLPIVALGSWRKPNTRLLLLSFAWVVAVACVSHALIAMASRVLSLTGVITIDYPFWATIDERKADLQDLFFNEPWFLVEGLLWAAMAWHGGLDRPARRWWVGSALAATAVATGVGLLTTFGVLPIVVVGWVERPGAAAEAPLLSRRLAPTVIYLPRRPFLTEIDA